MAAAAGSLPALSHATLFRAENPKVFAQLKTQAALAIRNSPTHLFSAPGDRV